MGLHGGTGSAVSTPVFGDPDSLNGSLRNVGGSQSDHWNKFVANQTIDALWLRNSDRETAERQHSVAVAALCGINPKDELEGMMAAQLIAANPTQNSLLCTAAHDAARARGAERCVGLPPWRTATAAWMEGRLRARRSGTHTPSSGDARSAARRALSKSDLGQLADITRTVAQFVF